MKNRTQFKLWWIHWLMAPFSWSRWTDISTFSYGDSAHLLQGKVNRRSNAKKFRVTNMKKSYSVIDIGRLPIEKLDECGLIDNEVKWPIVQ